MIGAVVPAVLRRRIGLDDPPLPVRHLARVVVEVGVAEARHRQVLGLAEHVQAVHVDDAQRLGQRVERVAQRSTPTRAVPAPRPSRQGTGSSASARLAAPRRPARSRSCPPMPGRVVHGAVVDLVAVHRPADAEVVPVRRVDDVLVLQRRDRCPRSSRPRSASSTVRIVFCSVIDAVTPSGTGLNSRVSAAFFSASKSCPRQREQLLRLVERDPALDGRAAHVLVGRHEVELLRRPCPGPPRTGSRPARSRAR